MTKILIIGGVAGGATALARLRRLDENAEIILFERGPHVSYANCGLPYYIGSVIDSQDKLLLASKESFLRQYNAEVRLRNEVLAINAAEKTVEVVNHETGETYTESYDKLLLSPGASPLKPPIKGIDLEGVYTLRTVQDAVKIKDVITTQNIKRAVIVGAGFVGMEVAENLAETGVKPIIVEMQNQIMGNFDFDMAQMLEDDIRKMAVPLFLDQSVQEISREADGRIKVTTSLNKTIYCDMVFLGLGVKPETGLAQKAGLKLNERGAITVNPCMQTSDPDIYAVGDAVEICDFITKAPAQIPLAGPANLQARIAADNMLGIPTEYQGAQGTFIIKLFSCVAAATGLTEKACQKAGVPYQISYTHNQSNAGYYPGAEMLTIKLIFSPLNGKLLGAQVVGKKGVDKRIDVLAAAIRGDMNVFDLINLELAYAPPFGSAKEPVNIAGMVAANIVTGAMPIFHWDQYNDIDWDNTLIIDVREPGELEKIGRIKTSINIPLGQIRRAAANDEIDKSKAIIITCAVGKRGYLATRILMQYGYDVYNLSGGFTTFKTMKRYIMANAKNPEKW